MSGARCVCGNTVRSRKKTSVPCPPADAIISSIWRLYSVAERRSVAADVVGSTPLAAPYHSHRIPLDDIRLHASVNLAPLILDPLVQDIAAANCRRYPGRGCGISRNIRPARSPRVQGGKRMSGVGLTTDPGVSAPTIGESAARGSAQARFHALPFVPRRFLRNGHLQTIAGNTLSRATRCLQRSRSWSRSHPPAARKLPAACSASATGIRSRCAPRAPPWSWCMASRVRPTRNTWSATPTNCGTRGPTSSA